MLHISIAQNATARKAHYWIALRCIAILQLHSIADQCASILVDLEKAVRRPAPGALLQWWQCGSVAVYQCGANVGNLTVRLPTPDGQSTTHFATPTVLYLQPSLPKAYVGLSICEAYMCDMCPS